MKITKEQTLIIIASLSFMIFIIVGLIYLKQSVNTSGEISVTDNTAGELTDSTTTEDVLDTQNETTTEEESTTTHIETGDITIAFTGDILLSNRLYERYTNGGITGFLSPLVADTLANADITFINQEFPFSNRGTPEPGKEYTYCVPTSYAHIFPEIGVDIVSLSNNHILDYGQDALLDTFITLDEIGIEYVGAGSDLDRAKQLITKKVRGKTIGFLAASRVVPSEAWYARNPGGGIEKRAGVFTTYDDTALCEEIKKAKQSCDIVIVYAHWGIERQELAADYQRIMAKNYIDAGADFVVGSHPHIMQGVEYYKNVPIVYSLGNFLFSNYYSRTTVLTLTISEDNNCSISFLPCQSQAYYTSECDDNGQKEFYSFLNRVSFDVSFNK